MSEIDNLKEEINDHISEIYRLKDENRELQDEIDDLNCELGASEDTILTLEKEILSIKNNNSEIENLFYDYKEKTNNELFFKKLDKFFIDTIDKR